MRAALVNTSGQVDNLILLDKDSDYTPPDGLTLIILDEQDFVAIGDIWSGGTWTPTIPTEPTTPSEPSLSLEAQVAQLQAAVDMLILKALEG